MLMAGTGLANYKQKKKLKLFYSFKFTSVSHLQCHVYSTTMMTSLFTVSQKKSVSHICVTKYKTDTDLPSPAAIVLPRFTVTKIIFKILLKKFSIEAKASITIYATSGLLSIFTT